MSIYDEINSMNFHRARAEDELRLIAEGRSSSAIETQSRSTVALAHATLANGYAVHLAALIADDRP